MSTKIAWTDETWNPIVGCSKVSEGCRNCYAERMARRLKGMGLPQYQDVVDEHGWTGKIGYASGHVWEKPLHWCKPRRVFVCSMGDLFHPDVGWKERVMVWSVMEQCPQHTFQILTKRPEAMRHFITEVWSNYADEHVALPNVWLGVTAENQRMADERIPELLSIRSAVRFVSVEPMIGPVDLDSACLYYHSLDLKDTADTMEEYDERLWVIVGCESGPKRRPMKVEWAVDLVRQCRAASIPVFVKQVEIDGRISHDPNEWPKELQVRKRP